MWHPPHENCSGIVPVMLASFIVIAIIILACTFYIMKTLNSLKNDVERRLDNLERKLDEILKEFKEI